MASLVLGAAFAWAAPAGYAGLAFSIGSTLGGMLFNNTPDQHREGPRLKELKVQSSAYGAPIPIIYGRSRLAGNVIWATEIAERVHTTSYDGKGSGGDVTSTSYTYDVDVAISICEGPIGGILKIWADSKLVYDANSDTIIASSDIGDLIIYKGTETQEVDSLIQSYNSDAPAYRGLCYILLENFQLGDFGNRIPNFTFEVAANGVPGIPEPTTLLGNYFFSPMYGMGNQHFVHNIDPPYDYLAVGNTAVLGGVGVISAIDPTRELQTSRIYAKTYGNWGAYYQGFDDPTLTTLGHSVCTGANRFNGSLSKLIYNGQILMMFNLYAGNETPRYWLYQPTNWKSFVDDDWVYIPIFILNISRNVPQGQTYIKVARAVQPILDDGTIMQELGALYSLGSPYTKYIEACEELYNNDWEFVWNPQTVYPSPIYHDFDPDDWYVGPFYEDKTPTMAGLWHAPDGKTYMMGRYNKTSPYTNLVIFCIDDKYAQTDHLVPSSASTLCKIIDVLDDLDKIYLVDQSFSSHSASEEGGYIFDIIYDGEAEVRFCFKLSHYIRDQYNADFEEATEAGYGDVRVEEGNNTAIWWSRLTYPGTPQDGYAYVHRIPLLGEPVDTDPVTLKSIVDNISERSNVTDNLRNNTPLADDLVDGYTLTKTMTGRTAIEPLALAYQFDYIESEGQLKAVERGDF